MSTNELDHAIHFPDFINIPVYAYRDSRINKSTSCLLMYGYLSSLHHASRKIYVSNAYLSKTFSIDERTVRSNFALLEEHGYIKRKTIDGKRRILVTYNIDSEITTNNDIDTNRTTFEGRIQASPPPDPETPPPGSMDPPYNKANNKVNNKTTTEILLNTAREEFSAPETVVVGNNQVKVNPDLIPAKEKTQEKLKLYAIDPMNHETVPIMFSDVQTQWLQSQLEKIPESLRPKITMQEWIKQIHFKVMNEYKWNLKLGINSCLKICREHGWGTPKGYLKSNYESHENNFNNQSDKKEFNQEAQDLIHKKRRLEYQKILNERRNKK